MDGGTVLALTVLSIVTLAVSFALVRLATTRPWYVIERGEDGSLLSIQQLKASEAEWADKCARLEDQLREEQARHRVELLRLGGHPVVPDPVDSTVSFNDPDDVVTLGERNPG